MASSEATWRWYLCARAILSLSFSYLNCSSCCCWVPLLPSDWRVPSEESFCTNHSLGKLSLASLWGRLLNQVPALTGVTHTHTTVLLLVWNMSGSTRVSRYQKGKTRKVKTNLDLLEQEIVSVSGICWAICKSAPHADNHANIPPVSFFTGRMPFLTPNQQRQSTEGN